MFSVQPMSSFLGGCNLCSNGIEFLKSTLQKEGQTRQTEHDQIKDLEFFGMPLFFVFLGEGVVCFCFCFSCESFTHPNMLRESVLILLLLDLEEQQA